MMFWNPETTPDGGALKFFASVRMDIRRINQIKENSGRVTGNRTPVKIVKNKVAAPFTECEFDIMFDEGISRIGSIIDLGLEHKILEKKGAWIAYNGKLIGQGREVAKQYLKNNPDCEKDLEGQIKKIVHVSGGTVLAESVDNEQNASI